MSDVSSTRPATLRLPLVLGAVAASLTVASALHLAGRVEGRGPLFDARDAGIAEAVIAAVLLGCAVAMPCLPRRARAIGLAGTGFAVIGFLIGLSITARAGHWPDIAYHLAILPVLLGTLAVLAGRGRGITAGRAR